MRTRVLRFAFVLLIVVSIAACKKTDPVPVADTPPPQTAGTAPSGQTATTTAESWIDAITIDTGTQLETNGSMTLGKATADFKAGQPVHVSIGVASAPANTPVKVVWIGQNGTKIAEESKSTSAGQQYLTFTSGQTKSWSKGEYQIEIWFGDTKVTPQLFRIV